MPISIPFLADAASFLRGAGQVDTALEKVGDSLDDVARDSARSGDKIGDELSDGAREGERSIDRLNATFRELATSAKQESAEAGAAIKRNIGGDAREASADVEELNREAKANLAETLSSFDGSVEGLVAGVQGTLGGVVGGLTGPAGIFAAVAGAAGIGLIMTGLQGAQEESDRLKERAGALGQEFITASQNGTASLDFLVSKLQELATETEGTNLSKLASAADRADSSFESLAQGYAGNVTGLKDLWREGVARQKQLEDEAEATDTTTDAGIKRFSALTKQSAAQSEYLDYLGQSLGVAQKAAEADELYARAGGAELEAKALRISAVNDAYDEAAGSADDYINSESKLFDPQAYIDAMLAKEQALRDYQETLATSALTDDAKTFLNEQGADAAAQFLQGYKNATPEQQAELNRIWSEAGKQNSGQYAGALTSNMPGTVKGPTVVLGTDTSDLDSKITSFSQTKLYKAIQLRVTDQGGKVIFQ